MFLDLHTVEFTFLKSAASHVADFNTCNLLFKIVSEYDQDIPKSRLQTNPWHREEEPYNNNETPGRQTKYRSQLSFPHQDDCKTRMGIK